MFFNIFKGAVSLKKHGPKNDLPVFVGAGASPDDEGVPSTLVPGFITNSAAVSSVLRDVLRSLVKSSIISSLEY